MAIIFYAVGGEGMGHATRSEAVINYLLKRGFKIVIFSYDRALNYLSEIFSSNNNVLELVEITGVNFIYEKNKFRLGKTIIKESSKIESFLLKNSFTTINYVIKYNPNLFIIDFEPFSNMISKLLKIPLICIDNINFVAKCKIDKKFSRSLNNKFIEYVLNFEGDYNFITTIFNIPLKEKYQGNTYLVGPIIRDCFYQISDKQEDFILVYQTSKSNTKLFDILSKSNEKYVIYGFNNEYTEKNLTFKKPGKENFARDLMKCKGVITNGGFTLISEAVVFQKPVFSIPVKKQKEQEINGYYVEKMGFGICSKEMNERDLNRFLDNIEEFKENLAKFTFNENEFYDILDKKINLLINYYKVPSRMKMIIKVKEKYNVFIQHIYAIICLKEKAVRLVYSTSYLIKKAEKMTKLLWIKKEKEIQEALIRKMEILGIVEKYFIISNEEKISYCIYKSNFGINKYINLVLLHGLGGNKSVFINMVLKFIDISKKEIDFNIIMIDLAGHGKSTNLMTLKQYSFSNQSEIINKIIVKEFGEQTKFNLVGHCYGSFVAIKLSNLIKDHLNYLILISSNPFRQEHRKIYFKLIKNKIIRESVKKLFRKIKLSKNLNNYDYEKFINSSDRNIIRIFKDIQNTSLKGYFASLFALLTNPIYEDFHQLLKNDAKIIMIHGEKDKIFSYKKIKNKVEKLKVKFITIPDSNHLLILNATNELTEIIFVELMAETDLE